MLLLRIGLLVCILLSGCNYEPDRTLKNHKFTRIRGVSMLPTLQDGGLYLMEPAPYESLQLGDIVVFVTRDGTGVCHRLHAQVLGGWTTKGDNNPVVDSEAMTRYNYVARISKLSY
jgi:signal peptidase I